MDKPKWTHRLTEVHERDGMKSRNFVGACCIPVGDLTENLQYPGYVRVRLRIADGSNDYGGEYNFIAVKLRKLIEEHSDAPTEVEDEMPLDTAPDAETHFEPDKEEPVVIPHEEPLEPSADNGGGDAEVHTPKE